MQHSLSRVGRLLATVPVIAALWIGLALPASAAQEEVASPESVNAGAPPIVTGDIQAGIEKHIAEQVARGDGYFTFTFEGQ